MNAIAEGTRIALGQPYGGGLAGPMYLHGGERRLLIVAPKAEGELKGVWHADYGDVAGASSWYDGRANTIAMAEAGSEIAQKARALRIGGKDDWAIPALDQLELLYRAFKPGTDKNYLYARAGINLSALPPTWPYEAEVPVQTSLEAFRTGGAEAFKEDYYWTSTQHPGNRYSAWLQVFSDGTQYYTIKGYRYLVRAVRSESI